MEARRASTLTEVITTSKIDRIVLGSADLRDDAATPQLLDRFHERGGRALDLANVYADGESQRAVGRWLRARHADMTLYAKGCHPPFCSPALVAREVDKARADAGVERLDVFLLHRDDPAVAADAWAEALLAEVERGAVGGFGVSNWTFGRYRELRAALDGDAGNLAAFSNHFSLVEMVTPTWPGCLAMSRAEIDQLGDVTVIAWAALAAGYFAGRDVESWDSAANAVRRAHAAELAERLQVTTPAVALAYVLHQPSHVRAAVGTRSVDHLDELLAAATVELGADDLAELESSTRS